MKKLIELGVAIDTAIDVADEYDGGYNFERDRKIRDALIESPTVQLEPLTKKEQRIFMSAIDREIEVCREFDKNVIREALEFVADFIIEKIINISNECDSPYGSVKIMAEEACEWVKFWRNEFNSKDE